MTTLARKLRAVDYFTLAWGTMVGVGWLVVMDDWLLRGGPLGGVLGFAIGGALLLPIGYVYGKLVMAMPDAAGEIAYTARVFPRPVSFATGWMMVLAYFIVCPWEAVAVGKIASYIFPSLDTLELYRVAGQPVYLPHLLIGLGLIGLLTLLNYRGIRLSAIFQNWTAFGTLALFVVFVGLGVSKGSPTQFPAAVYSFRIRFHSAGHPDRSLLHDRIRVGFESRGRSQPRIPLAQLSHRNLHCDCRRNPFLHYRDRGSGLCGSLEAVDRHPLS